MPHQARRALAALLTFLGTVLLAGFVSTATAAPAAAAVDCGYPVSKCFCPSLSINTTVPDVGERIRVTGAHFEPDSEVQLVLKPVKDTRTDAKYTVNTAYPDQDGAFETSIVMPREAIGTYDLHAVGGIPDGIPASCPVDPTQRLSIGGSTDGNGNPGSRDGSGGPNSPESTAFTGFNLLWLLLLAAALVALGVYAVRRGRTKPEVVRSIHG